MERESYLFNRLIPFAHKDNLSGDSTSRNSSGHAVSVEFDLEKIRILVINSKYMLYPAQA